MNSIGLHPNPNTFRSRTLNLGPQRRVCMLTVLRTWYHTRYFLVIRAPYYCKLMASYHGSAVVARRLGRRGQMKIQNISFRTRIGNPQFVRVTHGSRIRLTCDTWRRQQATIFRLESAPIYLVREMQQTTWCTAVSRETELVRTYNIIDMLFFGQDGEYQASYTNGTSTCIIHVYIPVSIIYVAQA